MLKRLFTLLLALVTGCNPSFAQNVPANPLQPTQSDLIYVIDNFAPLLQGHASPYNLTKGEATDAYNVRGNDEYGSLSKRLILNTYGSCSHSSAVTGLYRFYKSDGTKYTVTSASTFLDYISDTGTCTNLLSGLSTGARWNFASYKNNLIATDGYDPAQKWDGVLLTTADTVNARSAGFLTTQLGAPFTQLATGAGLTASKWYQYLIAYDDGTNKWYSNARSNPLLTGATTNKQVSLTGIPLGPATTTKRYLYRTLGDNSSTIVQADTTYYLVTTFNDNTTTTYTDSSSDATISAAGGAAPTWATVTAGGLNVTPPHAVFPFINQGYLWMANDPSGTQYGQSTVYFSSVNNPDYFLATNYFLVRPDDGDVITFINSYLGPLFIGKTNTITKISASAITQASWTVSQPFSFIGCVAPYSAVSTPLGIFYLGRYGIYNFNGLNSSLISDVVTNDIYDISQTNLGNIAATYYKNEYRMAYASQASGSGINNRVLLLDTIRNSWVKDTENINAWAIFSSNSDYGNLFSGSSGSDGNIYANSTNPTAIIERFLSDLNLGTFSHTGAVGTEAAPVLKLVSSAWNADASAWNADASSWVFDASPGAWTSPIFQINASTLSKLYWNSILPVGASATIAIRTASTSGGIAGAAWSSEFSNPAGSDISGVSANNYIQMRVTLSSSDVTVTPSLYVQNNYMIQLVYSIVNVAAETSIASSYTTGFLDLVTSPYMFYMSNMPKTIKEIDVYYEGTAGTMNFNLQNLKGDSGAQFSIDLSQNPPYQSTYFGNGIYKMYRWLPGINGGGSPPPYGDRFILSITEAGVTPWRIQRIAVRYDLNPYVPYH